MRPWLAGDGSCKLWDLATLTCLQNLGAASGGVTSCHIPLAGMADSAAGQHAVLVSPPFHFPECFKPCKFPFIAGFRSHLDKIVDAVSSKARSLSGMITVLVIASQDAFCSQRLALS